MNAGEQPAVVFAVASGKGGVGKTSICANLGISLARRDKRVCIFDADTNLANINILLGLTPQLTIEDYLSDNTALEDILLTGPAELRIVPAASGVADLVHLSARQRQRLLAGLQTLEREFDYLLVDCAAGIDDEVLAFMQAASYVMLVITSEPASLTDAYALLKVLSRRAHRRPVFVLVNRAASRAKALEVYQRFKHALDSFIELKVHSMGYILADERMNEAAHLQIPSVLAYPDALSSHCFEALAKVMVRKLGAARMGERFSDLWRDWIDAMPVDAAAPSQATYDQQQLTQLLAQAGQLIEDCPDEARADARNGLLELDRRYAQRFGADSALASADDARSLSLTSEAAARRSDSLPVTDAIEGEDCQLEYERAALRQAAAQAARLARLNPF